MAKGTKYHADIKKYNAQFKWGIKSGVEMNSWGMGVSFLEEWFYMDRHKDKVPLLLKLFTLIPAFKKCMKIIHIKFSD
jgi:hypothetical protein